jgi:hypothetical protein
MSMMFAPNTLLRRLAYTTLALLVMASLQTAPAMAQGQPVISIEPAGLDFGLMQQFQAETATIVITNTGDADLILGEVEATCGCTAAEPVEGVLEPGQSTNLDITFNSQKFRGDTVKYVKIHSNDPFNSLLEVPIHSYVHAALIIEPSENALAFHSVRAGSTKERTLTFSTEDVPELTVTATRYSEDLFDVQVRESDSGDPQEKIVVVAVRPDAGIGSFREAIYFETNLENRPKAHIEAIGKIVAPITIQPDKINLRYIPRNQPVTKIVTVGYEKGTNVDVIRAEIDLPGFSVKEIKRIPERNVVEIIIEGVPISVSDERAIAADGRMKGTLRVFTNLEAYPEVTASVMYLLKL